jgi:neutral ceramidase
MRLLTFLLISAFSALSAFKSSAAETLQAGTAAIETSPEVFPVRLRSGKSHLVHDPLHARAIAFQNGEGRAVITLIDAIGIGREETDEVKARAAEITGWKPEEMLISATHSHTTPKAGGEDPGSVAYKHKRFDGMLNAITTAIANLEPATVGFGSHDEPSEVRNRRWHMAPGKMPPNPYGEFDTVKMNPGMKNLIKPAAPIDPEICVINVRNRKNKPLGLIANYALHYVGGMPKYNIDGKEMGAASADYFGEFSRLMPSRLSYNPPKNFVAMMTNGTSGDINNIPFKISRPPREGFEQCRIVATKAADAAWHATREMEYTDSPLIATRQREIKLTYREVNASQVTKALSTLKGIKEKGDEAFPKKAAQYARQIVNFEERRPPEPVLIQAIRIGDQAIVSLPFEVLVEIGLELKEKSPFKHTFVIELANGSYGYLPPPNQHKLGGYETWLGTSRFVPESSVLLVKNLLEMLSELHSLE